ncbi:MAG: carboxymuconolactone decarboxylase family protein [Planctomycetota bacterium]
MRDFRAEAPTTIRAAFDTGDLESALEPHLRGLLDYAVKLTRNPAGCRRSDVESLRDLGASDEQIHATVQVAAYFNYINRVADGLGVDLDPEMEPAPRGET